MDENTLTDISIDIISELDIRLLELGDQKITRKEFYEETKIKISTNIKFITYLLFSEDMFSSDPEFLSFVNDLVELAVIKFAATLEKMTKNLIYAHFTDRANDAYSKQLIDSSIHGKNGHDSKNVDVQYITDTLKMFEKNTSFCDEFKKQWPARDYNRLSAGLKSLKENRNKVAHGVSLSQINVMDVIDYYNRSLQLLVKLDSILNESY